ncbi:MAG: recombinase family protein [Limnochordia bacterium]
MQPRAFSYIRFSSPEQEKGDSLRRQIQLSEEYCKQHGLILDDTLKLTDKGLSAYKGHHRTKGALGEFLRLVEEGKIPPGSVLLVENLDRLSREQILDALNQFTSIIKAGIKIVTLQDGMEYDQESINQNWAQLIISITYMARAHDESETKSKRISAVWENKRSKAGNGGKKLTAKAPAWLKLSQDRTKFILIPEAAKAVELIYRKKLAGKGTGRIERELNEDPNVWKPPKTGRNKTGVASSMMV